MASIINGSILKFEASVAIPSAGSSFATLKFSDTLSEGLEYINGNTSYPTSMSYKTASATTPTTLTLNTDFNVNYDATTRALTITTTNTNIVAPTEDTTVSIDFFVKVTNIDTAINNGNLINNSSFTMLNNDDTILGVPENANLSIPMSPYALYVMGLSYNTTKASGQSLPNAVYFFNAMTGQNNADLTYNIQISPNDNFTFDLGTEPNYDKVKVTIGSVSGPDVTRTVTVDGNNNIIIAFTHTSEMSNEVIHISIPTTSNTNIESAAVTSPQFIFGDANITDATNTILATAPNYSVQVNFNDTAKTLSSGSKSLLS